MIYNSETCLEETACRSVALQKQTQENMRCEILQEATSTSVKTMMTQDDRRTDGDIRKWSNGRKDVEICGDLSVVTYFGVFLAPDLKTRFSCSTVETSRNRPVFAF